MLISVFNLLWIVPVSMLGGIFLMALCVAGRDDSFENDNDADAEGSADDATD